MKKIILSALAISFIVISCTKKEEAANTTQADYADTYEDQITNPAKDSLNTDSVAAPGGKTGFVEDSTVQKK